MVICHISYVHAFSFLTNSSINNIPEYVVKKHNDPKPLQSIYGWFFSLSYHSLVKRGLKVIPALNLHNPTYTYIPAVVVCMHVVYVCAVIRVCACRLTNTLQLCMVLLFEVAVFGPHLDAAFNRPQHVK